MGREGEEGIGKGKSDVRIVGRRYMFHVTS
jgi:hypothetical protein